jgi:hydrogenase expression/formation protein HypD
MRKNFEWRGLNVLPYSALRIRSQFAEFDAEKRFPLGYASVPDHKACECGAILRGVKRPQDCKIFGTVCTPENPVGSCMVSSEGPVRRITPMGGIRMSPDAFVPFLSLCFPRLRRVLLSFASPKKK